MDSLSELMDLRGRCAIVTGGAGFMGLAICESLLELGAKVCVLDKTEEMCHERCAVLNNRNYAGYAIPVSVDLSEENDVKSAVKSAVCEMGALNIVVHAASFVGTTQFPGWAVPFEQQTIYAWDRAMRVNLTAAFLLVQAGREPLQKSGNGSVIFIGSIYGSVGVDSHLYEGTQMVTPAAYAASKGGLLQLARYLGTTLAPTVRVNTITAGGIWRKQPENFYQRYIQRTPLKRMAAEQDFKGSIALLASDLSAYVTGSNVVVDGGWTAW
jgi:NAD(P)-dependent dehydrogenase (short-subunit alcohol dehydrogenase family)